MNFNKEEVLGRNKRIEEESKNDELYLVNSGIKILKNFEKEEYLSPNKSLHEKYSKEVIKEEIIKDKRRNAYEKWFFRNCDNNNIPEINKGDLQDVNDDISRYDANEILEPKYFSSNESIALRNCKNISEERNEDTNDYVAWFKRHSIQREPEIKKENEKITKKNEGKFKTKNEKNSRAVSEKSFCCCYTSICKRNYPLILNPFVKNMNYCCDEHNKAFSFFCFKCDKHFCLECKNIHIDHSFINLDEIRISEEELYKEENSVKAKISALFNKYSNEQLDHESYEKIENFKEEIIEFNYFVIDTYRINKNNFYNYFNFYYLFRLKDDLKTKDNNMLKKFFCIYGFKKIINDLKNYYKKKKCLAD